MKRTRRWTFVKQDAIRFAGLGLSDIEIARKLDVDPSTVYRWRKGGKLGVRTPSIRNESRIMPASSQTASQWSKSVRETYALDATDEQLVDMGEAALLILRDPASSSALRFQAMREFRATVKQLALVARREPDDKPKPEEPTRKTFEVQRRAGGGDPRAILSVAK